MPKPIVRNRTVYGPKTISSDPYMIPTKSNLFIFIISKHLDGVSNKICNIPLLDETAVDCCAGAACTARCPLSTPAAQQGGLNTVYSRRAARSIS